ncbi:MAG: hypothetical protein H7267_13485, partial [Sandarakinorhabdus sp.]|nr:hypothetical protein [Sandarakinorhabdus sp.]
SIGRDFHQDLLWIDYAAALSLHRVVTANAAERRLQRLATASVEDNRISFGCINVPADYYDSIILPLFTGTTGIVYILPEDGRTDTLLTPDTGSTRRIIASLK